MPVDDLNRPLNARVRALDDRRTRPILSRDDNPVVARPGDNGEVTAWAVDRDPVATMLMNLAWQFSAPSFERTSV